MANSITGLLEERALESGKRVFCKCRDGSHDLETIHDNAARVAANLAKRGVGPGTKVMVLSGNCVEFLYVFLGLGRIEAVCVPVNPLLNPEEIAYIAKDAEVDVLITVPQLAPAIPKLRAVVPALREVFVFGDEPCEGAEQFAVLQEPVDGIAEIAADRDSDAALIYTSGTTGQPKGVVLSHRNYLSNARMMIKAVRVTDQDRFFCVLPLYHVNAQVVTVLAPLSAGADLVLMKKFSPMRILPMIDEFKPTIMSAVPTVYHVMCQMPKAAEYDVSSIRFFVSGAAPLPEETYRLVGKVLKKPLVQGYGLSEATCASAVANYEDPIKWNSVGPALPYTNIRIVDKDGVDSPVGDIGEILVSGPAVMKEYYNNPEATQETLEGGWLYTGDLGRFDEDGYLYIEGRRKDMIIRGGQNIYPQQIENVLSSLEGVAESCVVGVDDERWGQEVLAVIKCADGSKLDEDTVKNHCKEHLANYKTPRYVEFVDEFPKTATGKIKKTEVAAKFDSIVADKHK